MPIAECQVAELKRAYQTLGVPFSASALSIKQAYRRIAKRWHPDLYPSGTLACDEATQMMKRINEAYSLIQHAPLRYHIESYPVAAHKRTRYPNETQKKAERDTLPITDRFEFWVRFVCGAFFGAFISLRVLLDLFPHPVSPIALAAGLAVGCGLGAAKYGDRFWYAILQRWWLWG